MKLYKNEQGEKLYPVCRWEQNQHKIYNAVDRAHIRMWEDGHSDKACDEVDRLESLLDAFNENVIDGLVYAPYKVGQQIKAVIAAYDMRVGA